MKIQVCGMDPSLTHWGMAEATLDLDGGYLEDVRLSIAVTAKGKNKQIRTNADDVDRALLLGSAVLPVAKTAKVIFVEVPVGSQNASGMKSYGVCCGILGMLRALDIQIIHVDPAAVKRCFTGNQNASKAEMIARALKDYPDANWPRHQRNGSLFKKGDLTGDAEHLADAIAAIEAGVQTPEFLNVMRILKSV